MDYEDDRSPLFFVGDAQTVATCRRMQIIRHAKWMLEQHDVDDIKKARIKRELRAMGELE